jgi:hypothetical protein
MQRSSIQRFSICRQRSAPRIAGFYTITGESLVMRVHWPGGGLVWNLPIAIHGQRRGHATHQPVVDGTRLAQVALMLLAAAMLVQFGRKHKEKPHA